MSIDFSCLQLAFEKDLQHLSLIFVSTNYLILYLRSSFRGFSSLPLTDSGIPSHQFCFWLYLLKMYSNKARSNLATMPYICVCNQLNLFDRCLCYLFLLHKFNSFKLCQLAFDKASQPFSPTLFLSKS